MKPYQQNSKNNQKILTTFKNVSSLSLLASSTKSMVPATAESGLTGHFIIKRKNFLSRGFTLIELLATVAIMAITLTIGVPGFNSIITNSRLTASANTMVSALQRARSESIKQLKIVGIAPKDGSNWQNGWVLWVGSNSTSNIVENFDAFNNVTVNVSPNFTPSYRPDGRINGSAGSFTFTKDTDSRTVTIGNSGRIQVTTSQKS